MFGFFFCLLINIFFFLLEVCFQLEFAFVERGVKGGIAINDDKQYKLDDGQVDYKSNSSYVLTKSPIKVDEVDRGGNYLFFFFHFFIYLLINYYFTFWLVAERIPSWEIEKCGTYLSLALLACRLSFSLTTLTSGSASSSSSSLPALLAKPPQQTQYEKKLRRKRSIRC